MARSVKGGGSPEPAVGAETGALEASGPREEDGARGALGAPDEAVALMDEAVEMQEPLTEEEAYTLDFLAHREEWKPTVAWMVENGYVGEAEAKDFMCVLGRRAVSAIHECLGDKCMAWRKLRMKPVDAPDREYGYCGLAGEP